MIQLNCLNGYCSAPVVRCRELITTQKPEAFSVLVDTEAALENVQRFLRRNGYTVTPAQQAGKLWEIKAVLPTNTV